MRKKDEFFPLDYPLPQEVQHKLIELGYTNNNTPWYSFSLFILVPIVLIIYLIFGAIKSNILKEDSQNFELEFLSKIDTIKVNTFLEFQANYNEKKLAQVKFVDTDSVHLRILKVDSSNQLPGIDRFSPKLVRLFSENNIEKTFWISKTRLKELRKSSTNNVGLVVPEFTELKKYYLNKMVYYFGPYFETSEISFDHTKKTGKIKVINKGYDCQFNKSFYKLDSGEVLSFDKNILKNGDSTTFTYQLVKPIEKYETFDTNPYGEEMFIANIEKFTPILGHFQCTDLVNSKKSKIYFFSINSKFKLVSKNE